MSQCETGCMNFTGGERRHHKDCVHYPESLTKQYDDLLRERNLIAIERDMIAQENQELEEHRNVYNMNRKQSNEVIAKLFDENKALKKRMELLETIIRLIRTCADTHCDKCKPMFSALEEMKANG